MCVKTTGHADWQMCADACLFAWGDRNMYISCPNLCTLQVIQKQKSPQKPTRSSKEKGENPAEPASSESREPKASLTAAEGVPPPSAVMTSNSEQAASGSSQPAPLVQETQTVAPAPQASTRKGAAAHKEKTTTKSNSASKPQPRRTKSRLAAKFNFPNWQKSVGFISLDLMYSAQSLADRHSVCGARLTSRSDLCVGKCMFSLHPLLWYSLYWLLSLFLVHIMWVPLDWSNFFFFTL